MKIYDPKTGHTKMVVDECVDPYRPNCKGCEYSLDPTMRDGGCLAGYSEEQRKYYRDNAERVLKECRRRERERLLGQADSSMKSAYQITKETLISIATKQAINSSRNRLG